MVKDHSDSERGNPLPPHRLLFPISSKGSFICIIPQTGICYTSRGALAGTRNSSVGPPWNGFWRKYFRNYKIHVFFWIKTYNGQKLIHYFISFWLDLKRKITLDLQGEKIRSDAGNWTRAAWVKARNPNH